MRSLTKERNAREHEFSQFAYLVCSLLEDGELKASEAADELTFMARVENGSEDIRKYRWELQKEMKDGVNDAQ